MCYYCLPFMHCPPGGKSKDSVVYLWCSKNDPFALLLSYYAVIVCIRVLDKIFVAC